MEAIAWCTSVTTEFAKIDDVKSSGAVSPAAAGDRDDRRGDDAADRRRQDHRDHRARPGRTERHPALAQARRHEQQHLLGRAGDRAAP